MDNGFKKFIDVSGKSATEIKKNISELLNNVVDTVVDDATQLLPSDVRRKIKQSVREATRSSEKTEYKAEKIPPRPQKKESYVDPEGYRIPPLPPEPPRYDPRATAYPREPVYEPQDEQEEFMINKIREMRKLEEISHNNYIVKRCAEVTMVRQGEFMANVTDDFPRRVFCALPRPIYAAMSNSQLRTYFSWRTDWQLGIFEPIDKPYILLYCYEVLNKIGFDSSDKAFAELTLIWDKLHEKADYLKDCLPRWIKDFTAYNRVTAPLPDFSDDYSDNCTENSTIAEIMSGNYANKLDYLAENSAYNIKDSIYFTPETKPLLNGACEAALKALEPHFKKFGIEFSSLLCGKMKKDHSWEPFAGALVDLERMDGFQAVEISSSERYSIKRGETTLEKFEFSPSKHIIGYILKSVEARLRRRTGFSHALSPRTDMFKNEISNRGKLREAVTAPEFESLIPDAVDIWCRQNNVGKPLKHEKLSADDYVIRKVEIDISKLGEVREQAELNAARLIIDSPDENIESDTSGSLIENNSPDDIPIDDLTDRISDDSFNEAVAEYAEPYAPDEPECEPAVPIIPTHRSEALDKLSGDWQELALNLTPLQINALKALLNGEIENFCRSNSIFAETLFEQINAEALDKIGDVIIESGAPIEDYLPELQTLAQAF